MELKELMTALPALMSVSGYEKASDRELYELVGEHFDECFTDALNNHFFVKRSGKENAPKILIDSHYDEIGMIVTRISDDGFVSVAPIGGVDTRILQSGEVIIYGKEKVYGVIGSTPPHLAQPGDADKLKSMEELYIDTGIPGEELREIVRLGSPVGFKPVYTELLNDRICGKSFDDKACAASVLHAVMNTPREELVGDVYVMLSSQEEVGLRGARVGGFGIYPDYALVLDVTFAYTPDTEIRKDVCLESGVCITLSPITDRRLTRMAIDMCREREIKYTLEAAPKGTGTNANVMGITREGIPTALASIPIKSMHSPSELLSMEDARSLADFTVGFITSTEIAEVFGK
ncbi:MAG: M42 family metallopeptidase [Ruminococcaceae bacterium]|nr:M42 family metallopeptidase [Oscillospiraceae bacterium]